MLLAVREQGKLSVRSPTVREGICSAWRSRLERKRLACQPWLRIPLNASEDACDPVRCFTRPQLLRSA